MEEYEKHSIFSKVEGGNQDGWQENHVKSQEDATQMVLGQIRYILHEPNISKARKMLVIEQFQNDELAKLQTKLNYSGVMDYFTWFIKDLVTKGILIEDDPEIMAAQFCLPISMWINLCDREPDREPEIMALIERHIRHFFTKYKR